MKDITVALELSVPKEMTDEQIRCFIEFRLHEAVEQEARDNAGLTILSVESQIDAFTIDVVGIHEGTFPLKDLPVVGFRMVADKWRQEIELGLVS